MLFCYIQLFRNRHKKFRHKTEPCYKQTIYEENLHKVLFDIISKQAEILLNIDSVADLDKIKLQTVQTIEIKKRIEQCQKAMQNLYEQLLTKEITLDEYKSLKENHDADIRKFQKQYESSYQSVEQAKIDSQAKSQLIQIARDVKKENTLTQALSDTLIDKVLVYPDNRIEVVWKIQDFCMDMKAVKIG